MHFDSRRVRHLIFRACLLTVIGTTLAALLSPVALVSSDLFIEFRFHGLVIKAVLSYFLVMLAFLFLHSQYTIYPFFPFVCASAPFNNCINSLVCLYYLVCIGVCMYDVFVVCVCGTCV